MTTPADGVDLALAHEHREMQVAVRAAFLAEFAELWQLVDGEDLDRSVPVWLRAVWPLLRLWFDQSAAQARQYWTAAGGDGAYLPDLLELGQDETIGGLLVTGPGQIRTSRRLGRDERQAQADGLASASRSAGRLVLAGGRRTIEQAAKADPEVTRWQRITDGDPCEFCAMLADRGAVYLSQRSASGTDKRDLADLARYHDGCGCTVAPVRTPAPARRRRRRRR